MHYVQVGDGEHSRETDVHSEYARQREHMERTVSALRKKLAKDTEIHRTDKIRVMQVMTQRMTNHTCPYPLQVSFIVLACSIMIDI